MTLASPDWGWTADEIAAWDRSATCAHAGFDALDTPQRPMETCPDCGVVLRMVTTDQGWADEKAERRKEERDYEDRQRRARIEDRQW